MDKKEQLKKALWAYGNYNLKGYKLFEGVECVKEMDSSNIIGWLEEGSYKPLLYPISALTEEIEHPVTGEKFVPEERLKCFFPGIRLSNDFNSFIDDHDVSGGWVDVNYMLKITELMAEWHINYMNLPKKFWIDKRTIKQ